MSNPLLLIELEPLPKCCFDANDFGVFVLTAKKDQHGLRFTADLLTLSTTMDLEQEVLYPLRLDIQERLLEAMNEVSVEDLPAVPLLAFMEQSKAVFRELINVLVRERAQRLEPDQKWKLEQVQALHQQLHDVEATFGDTTSVQYLSEDLNQLTLQHVDDCSRIHGLELDLRGFPSTIAVVKSGWGPWESQTENLCKILQDFIHIVTQHQQAYRELDELDSRCIILHDCHATFERRIQIPDTNTTMLLTLDPFSCSPQSIHFMGGQSQTIESVYKKYNWSRALTVVENLEQALNVTLSPIKSPLEADNSHATPTQDPSVDCAICYCRELIVDELAELPTELCETKVCGRFYHSSCLREWLKSLPTARISFDRVIGACPYCQEPISVVLMS
jgi:E3 ubiquitin-protein ligase FANCL